MAVILITVGVSIFQDLFEKSDYKRISSKPLVEISKYEDESVRLRNQAISDLPKAIQNSSEISSLLEIIKILNISQEALPDQEIHLLCPDTLAGLCATWCISSLLQSKGFDPQKIKDHQIPGLQVKDQKIFEESGIPNLLKKIDSIIFEDKNGTKKVKENVVLNITGGYKIITPHLSILAQIYRIPLYYLFEENEYSTPSLLKMPLVPVQFDWEFIEFFGEILSSNYVLNSAITTLSFDQIEILIKFS
jgi:CRISPR/Cas system-associated protein Csm6